MKIHPGVALVTLIGMLAGLWFGMMSWIASTSKPAEISEAEQRAMNYYHRNKSPEVREMEREEAKQIKDTGWLPRGPQDNRGYSDE